MEQVLKKIKEDYSKTIRQAIRTNINIDSFEDWLHINPTVLGQYTLEQLSNNFDFEKEAEL